MSAKKDGKSFDDDDDEKEEDKKCPPKHVPSLNPNKVGMKKDASKFSEELKEEIREGDEPDGWFPEANEYERRVRNEALGTDYTLDNKARMDIESGGGKGMVSHLRGPDVSPGAEAMDIQAQPPSNPQRHSIGLAPIPPGVEHVKGPDYRGIEDDNFTVTMGENNEDAGTIEPSPPTVSAKVVNDEEEKNRFMQDFLQNAVVADIVPHHVADIVPHHRGWRWKFAGAFLVLVLIAVVAIVLAKTLPQDQPDQPPQDQEQDPTWSPAALSKLLSSVSFDKGDALNSSSTPQNMAFKWTVTNNTYFTNNTYPGFSSNETIIQRYALATLFYSANGGSWTEKSGWLGSGDECSWWVGLSCEITIGVISNMDLSTKNLSGRIPQRLDC
jgi:hypothetical protein